MARERQIDALLKKLMQTIEVSLAAADAARSTAVMRQQAEQTAKALKEQDARRDSIFAQSVEAQKNRDDLMAKKFAEAVKKAKEDTSTGKPLRDFDLD